MEAGVAPWWRPFRHFWFAALWTVNTLGLIGIAMSDTASGWLMTSLNPDPIAVSWVQVAANLPMFLFTLLAGALADMFDVRRFLLATQSGVVVITAAFAGMVSLAALTPSSLLAITFVLSAAWTMAAPAWLAILPLLTPREDLDAATAINSAAYNVSRAIGPALGGLAMAALGVAAPLWIFTAVNIASVFVLLRWREPRRIAAPLPVERLSSALRIGFRHVANNLHMLSTIGRTAAFFPFASAYWALLPLLARQQLQGGPQTYGILLGAIGAGAIGGAFALTALKRRLGPDRLVAAGGLATAAALVLFAFVRDPLAAVALCAAAGAAWIVVLATLYVSAQLALPDWARGRGLAIFLTVIFGAMTCGGAIWGQVAQSLGLPTAHLIAALCVASGLALTAGLRIQTGAAVDQSPSEHWRLPELDQAIADTAGPVLVVVEYRVADDRRSDVERTLRKVGHERKRDGAYSWGLFRDPTERTRLWETFLIESWLEFRFFCERVTKSDRVVEEQLLERLLVPPKVTFMIATTIPSRSVS